MHPGLVPRMLTDFGIDLIIGVGGGIHAHPIGAISGAKAFHQAIEAVKKGIPLKEYSKNKKELKKAIEKWGTYEEKMHIYTLTK